MIVFVSEEIVEERYAALNTRLQMCPPLLRVRGHIIGQVMSREPRPTPPAGNQIVLLEAFGVY